MCKCRSHGTFPLFGLQGSYLNICYYHQDLHRRPLRPGSRPRFCSDRRALLLIRAWHLPRRPADFDFHDHRHAVLIDQHPLWDLDGPNGELAGRRQEPAGAEARQTARAAIHIRDDDVSTGISTVGAWAAAVICIGPHPEPIG
ncbi:Protein TAR1 [Senna tora]|uniref:Protein TAR1 n=1 Tax=Senna tora TaxID=362788 RepID=A0A834SD34_9FABA|nr:Protein TAR1 [Senna tora]